MGVSWGCSPMLTQHVLLDLYHYPTTTPIVGRDLEDTHVDVQLYVLVRDERQCGQSEFHRPKSPKGNQTCMERREERKTP